MSKQTIAYSVFLKACEALDLSEGDLSEKIGLSRSAHNGWYHKGEIPLWAALAVRYLRQQANKTSKQKTLLYFVRIPAEHKDNVLDLLNRFDVEYNELDTDVGV